MQTAMRFLKQAKGKVPGLPADKLQQVQVVNQQLKGLQKQLQQANDMSYSQVPRGTPIKSRVGYTL